MIILDAHVLIGFLDSTDFHHANAVDLLARRYVGGFGANILSVAEALVHPTRANLHDAASASLARIGVRVIPLDATDAAGLARVRNNFRVRMPDAVALYTALNTGSALATFDDSLAAAAKQAGVTVAR